MKNFVIHCLVFDVSNNILLSGQQRIKNQPNEFSARVNFEQRVRSEHATAHRITIMSCKEETRADSFIAGVEDFFTNILKR